MQRVKDAWQGAVPRLLVFDNCEEEALLEAWRPVSGGCRVLVTSRRSHWSPTLAVTALSLDLLPRPDSIELLCRYGPDLAPADPELNAIAAVLDDLPLALDLAGSYLRAHRGAVTPVLVDDHAAAVLPVQRGPARLSSSRMPERRRAPTPHSRILSVVGYVARPNRR